MSRSTQILALVLVFAVAMCPNVGVLTLLQRGIDDARVGLISPGNMSAREHLIELGSTVMLGGFRTVAVAILWTKAAVLKDRREHAELDGVIRLIAKFQPTDIDAQTHQIWNMAYNVQYDAPNAVTAWKWVKRALDFGKDCVKRNPHHPKLWKLCWQIAWVYSHRCADLGDQRTRYFEKQVEKSKAEGGEGKSPYLVAADWYEKAWRAALASGEKSGFAVYRIAMWAYAYANLARRCEKRGDLDDTTTYRKKAIEVHERLIESFGDQWAKDGQKDIAELRALIRLQEQTARAKRIADWIAAARGWRRLAERDPRDDEALRACDRAAGRLDELAAREADPAQADPARFEALITRYRAAPLERDSADAVNALEKSAAHFDRQLDSVPSVRELAGKLERVRWVARAHTRVALHSRRDKLRVNEAAASLTRFASVLPRLPRGPRAAAHGDLVDLWCKLLRLTDIDSLAGRDFVRDAALDRQQQFMETCQGAGGLMIELGRQIAAGSTPEQNEGLIGRLAQQKDRIFASARRMTACWSVLLRKESPYARVAPVAEQQLAAAAGALDALVRGGIDQLRRPNDRRTLAALARTLWRMLHEYSPNNATYKEKSRPPASTARPRSSGHHHHH